MTGDDAGTLAEPGAGTIAGALLCGVGQGLVAGTATGLAGYKYLDL